MRITSKGQVTIPVAIRRKAGLGVVTLRKTTGVRPRGQRVVDAMRGRATTGLTTNQIMALTRR